MIEDDHANNSHPTSFPCRSPAVPLCYTEASVADMLSFPLAGCIRLVTVCLCLIRFKHKSHVTLVPITLIKIIMGVCTWDIFKPMILTMKKHDFFRCRKVLVLVLDCICFKI